MADRSSHTFALHLQEATRYERIEGVSAFVGEDASGGFGIRAGHERLMTTLVFGLARFCVGDDDWQYLALPGGVLYFRDNELFLSTRRCFRDRSYERISALLEEELEIEERDLRSIKLSLHRMEEEILRRLREIGRTEEPIL